jgi:hypothetical protein
VFFLVVSALSAQVCCHDDLEISSSTDLQASQSVARDDIFSAVLNNNTLSIVWLNECRGAVLLSGVCVVCGASCGMHQPCQHASVIAPSVDLTFSFVRARFCRMHVPALQLGWCVTDDNQTHRRIPSDF